MLPHMLSHLIQQERFIIVRGIRGQLVRKNIVRRRYQHHRGIPVPDQLLQQRDLLVHLYIGIVRRQMLLYQVSVRAQIDPAHLFFL